MSNIPDRLECRRIVSQLWPFLDGALPDSERERVVRHVELCGDCRSHFDYARAFLDAVHAARPDAAHTEALRHRVVSALAGEGFRPDRE